MGFSACNDVVDVWKIRIPPRVDDLAVLLTESERAHAARFLHQRDRDRFTSVRAWLRRLLAAYLNQSPSELRFELGEQGKPALIRQPEANGIRFNVSHSGDMGIVAICKGREVGVDVEEIRDNFDVIELGRTCFSRAEQDGLHACAPDSRVERFFRLWTAKEACIKALGGGLSIPLQEFTVDVQRDAERWSVDSVGHTTPVVEVRSLSVPLGYAGAVTALGADWKVQERDVADWTP